MVQRRRGTDEQRERVDKFIAERSHLVRALSDADLDAVTERAIAGLDKDETLREIEALRESWKRKPRARVQHRPQRRRAANG
jgi:hypothetical protein